MAYSQDNFQEWIFLIDDEMDSFTNDFSKENNLKLDYSVISLDELEKRIFSKFKDRFELKEDSKL
ncbi:hypothetical protein [Apibacter sp. HY039]|uniref:hypothetical protein n=1 Tax=Apibacter sp. HY039 TaxID=2501476 RepID=UPI001C86A5E2|nr:hypothetical protein [Apibacter sp. HY039]